MKWLFTQKMRFWFQLESAMRINSKYSELQIHCVIVTHYPKNITVSIKGKIIWTLNITACHTRPWKKHDFSYNCKFFSRVHSHVYNYHYSYMNTCMSMGKKIVKEKFHFLLKLKLRLSDYFFVREESTNLIIAVFFIVLLLNGGAKVEGSVVNQIRGVLRQIQNHEIKAQPDHTIWEWEFKHQHKTQEKNNHKRHKKPCWLCYVYLELGVWKWSWLFTSIGFTTFSYGHSRWVVGRNQRSMIWKQSNPQSGTWFPEELNSRKP